MSAALLAKEGIHAPATINPDFDASAFQGSAEINYVIRSHDCLHHCHHRAFFAFDDMSSLRSSMAPSILCWLFQKSFQRLPFSLSRAKIVLMFKFSGCRLRRSSRASTGADTGALGNARTL